jgi:hypothetical protein
MRVVTAQLPPSTRTGPQSQATTLGAIRSHPLPSGGSREENLHRLATSGYLSDLSDLPTSAPPRWREKGPGDEGGDRATATLNTHGTAVPCYDAGGYT